MVKKTNKKRGVSSIKSAKDEFKIVDLKAYQVLDSRGNPTIKVVMRTNKGRFYDSVPAGRSKGRHEALELRDGGEKYGGLGVQKAVDNVNKILKKKLVGMKFNFKLEFPQSEFDKILIKLDGTKNKSKLGANAILGTSMCFARAYAFHKNLKLYEYLNKVKKEVAKENKIRNPKLEMKMPVPCFNIINGGVHAANALDVQEFMIIPSGVNSFEEAYWIGAEIYHELKSLILPRYGLGSVNVGDEGGFAPPARKIDDALELLNEALNEKGHKNKVKIGLDVAATELRYGDSYRMDDRRYTKEALVEVYKEWIKKYPIISLEDPFSEDDYEGWKLLRKEIGTKVQYVGDDLIATNPDRVVFSEKMGLANALLLKINQIGTISEAIKACVIAEKYNWHVMVSHRSGETTDAFIADLVVGLGCGQIKSGAPCRGERVAKYNRLLEIEKETNFKFAKDAFEFN